MGYDKKSKTQSNKAVTYTTSNENENNSNENVNTSNENIKENNKKPIINNEIISDTFVYKSSFCNKNCIIVANGAISDYNKSVELIDDNCFLIACDGGLNHIHNMRLTPDLIIGDLDSVDSNMLNFYNNVAIEKFSKYKDKTDLELAILKAIDLNFSNIKVLGACGNRTDHTVFNLLLLSSFSKYDIDLSIVNEKEEIVFINKTKAFYNKKGKTFSIVPISKTIDNISLFGAMYELFNDTLYLGSTRSISNIITKEELVVSFSNGEMLVIFTDI